MKIKSQLYLPLYCIVILFMVGACGAARKATVREEKIDLLIETARSYKGVPYRYGGTSRKGMDCSGLLVTSYKAIDMSIPRTSADQSKMGTKVKYNDVEKGDLVFFAAGKKKRKITHVGLVTDVKNSKQVLFIHSSSSKGVMEANLKSAYFKKTFVKAVRPF